MKLLFRNLITAKIRRFGMNRIFIISVVFILLFLPSFAYTSDLSTMRTSLVEGDVQIQPYDLPEWIPVSVNMPLRDGDRLWVPLSGRLEIQMIDGSYVRLDENTSLTIDRAERAASLFYLKQGQAYINFNGRDRNDLTIETPVASLIIHKRATFIMRLDAFERLEVSVIRGTVYADSGFNSSTIHAGKTLFISKDGYAELLPIEPPDYWERWNRDRDVRLQERRYSYRYLPDELHVYAHDFDEHGTWIYERTYGHVWRPQARLSVGWSPYRLGRWTWRGGDYVWISYEPWGWAPYHYGRWAFSVSIGWYWVPPVRGKVYWSPGYVSWVYTPTYVAWVPLAPREIYYGYGYYGPYSVNINITKHKRYPRHRYKNAYVKNSVTIVHHDTFIKGKYRTFRPRKNPFLHEKIHIGRPKIKPARTSYMPLTRTIERSKRPPEKIRKPGARLDSRKRFYKREQKDSRFYNRPIRKLTPIKKEQYSKERRSGTDQLRKLKPRRPSQDDIKREKPSRQEQLRQQRPSQDDIKREKPSRKPYRKEERQNIYRRRSEKTIINEQSSADSRDKDFLNPLSIPGKQQASNVTSVSRGQSVSKQKSADRQKPFRQNNVSHSVLQKRVRKADKEYRGVSDRAGKAQSYSERYKSNRSRERQRRSSVTLEKERPRETQRSYKKQTTDYGKHISKGTSSDSGSRKRSSRSKQGKRSGDVKNFGFKQRVISRR
jgi:hypothetical protein